MPTIILEKIKQAAGKTYALVDASDVEMPDGSRLDAYTEGMMVIAEAVVGQVSSLDAQVKDLDNRLDEFSPGVDEETAERIAAVEESTETALGGMLAVSMRVNELEKVAASVDLTNYESNGVIVETYSDGSTKTYTMTFDENGNPVKIVEVTKNAEGEVLKEAETTLTW